MRITSVDVRSAFNVYKNELATLGVATDGMTLTRTPSGWQAVKADQTSAPGFASNGMMAGYLGKTSREAHANLRTAARSLKFAGEWMVQNAERVLR